MPSSFINRLRKGKRGKFPDDTAAPLLSKDSHPEEDYGSVAEASHPGRKYRTPSRQVLAFFKRENNEPSRNGNYAKSLGDVGIFDDDYQITVDIHEPLALDTLGDVYRSSRNMTDVALNPQTSVDISPTKQHMNGYAVIAISGILDGFRTELHQKRSISLSQLVSAEGKEQLIENNALSAINSLTFKISPVVMTNDEGGTQYSWADAAAKDGRSEPSRCITCACEDYLGDTGPKKFRMPVVHDETTSNFSFKSGHIDKAMATITLIGVSGDESYLNDIQNAFSPARTVATSARFQLDMILTQAIDQIQDEEETEEEDY
ncbi:uncharacterized protein I206_107607 [Kwoniella pini CBS 10737]|uniref:Uncharacterized protein n=1 Tax=Kwoniella pini CBS 10737 TaxID=1296096 RepID=A0A1B9HXR8_9TREE|nr:uncharacterized protein I206_05940 [Kwoniella pini CBS 10737]OCF48073.1 hypothetical protein I206_05940 [Kwoniella pini CBS 10737]